MNQSKLESFIEAVVNTFIGFFISLVVWVSVAPLFGYEVKAGTSILLTGVFTVVSVARSYFLRRFFNARLHAAIHNFVRKFHAAH